MDLGDVMDQVAARLRAIGDLTGRTYAYPQATVVAPAAVVSYPDEYTFDETYGRGMDRMQLPVVVVVGRPTDRSTRDHLAKFCNGSGAESVKQVLETGEYDAFHTLRVVDIDFDVVSIAGVDHMAALFTLDIAGPGSP